MDTEGIYDDPASLTLGRDPRSPRHVSFSSHSPGLGPPSHSTAGTHSPGLGPPSHGTAGTQGGVHRKYNTLGTPGQGYNKERRPRHSTPRKQGPATPPKPRTGTPVTPVTPVTPLTPVIRHGVTSGYNGYHGYQGTDGIYDNPDELRQEMRLQRDVTVSPIGRKNLSNDVIREEEDEFGDYDDPALLKAQNQQSYHSNSVSPNSYHSNQSSNHSYHSNQSPNHSYHSNEYSVPGDENGIYDNPDELRQQYQRHKERPRSERYQGNKYIHPSKANQSNQNQNPSNQKSKAEVSRTNGYVHVDTPADGCLGNSYLDDEDYEDYADIYDNMDGQRFRLRSLGNDKSCDLFRRRSLKTTKGGVKLSYDFSQSMSLGNAVCSRCADGFTKDEEIVNSNGEVWHTQCFVEWELEARMAGAPTGSLAGSISDILDAEGYVQEEEDGIHSNHGGSHGNVYDDVLANYHQDGSSLHGSQVRVANGAPVVANGGYVANGDGSYLGDRAATPSSLSSAMVCSRCEEPLNPLEEIVNFNGEVWHPQCFLCAQCFQQFPDGVFYEFDGRKYCEHDFNVLFAPCCGRCGEFIVGRVIKAMNTSWHPECFLCEICRTCLADAGFIKNAGRALCRECNAKEKALGMGKYVCHKCHSIIDEGHIKFKGEAYHPYHFNCHNCEVELNADAREKGGELYCLRCHDKMGIPICGACRRPIEERVVHALGKAWHVEHFVCAKCEKPFYGTRHYEKKGAAYCETHYHQLFGNICYTCNTVIAGDVFSALNKSWCVEHFACSLCDKKMNQKTKFYEFDLRPVCKLCYEKFPSELKKRLKKMYDQAAGKKPAPEPDQSNTSCEPIIPLCGGGKGKKK